MRIHPCSLFLLFLLLSRVPETSAQQTEADRKLLDEIRAKAENGDASSQNDLGNALRNGTLGLAKDEVAAVLWYLKAAEQGLAEAQFNMAACYSTGRGVVKDEAEAVKWFRKAAEQNFARAQYNLGWSYSEGQGVARDDVEAVKWYRKAAEQNNASAQNNLGSYYFHGRGVPKDEIEAVKWFRKAAEQNFAEAQWSLGVCYSSGTGVARDYIEAVKWFRKAADQNNATAQYGLGCSYWRGDGVPKDYVEGYKWYLLAAAQGVQAAKDAVSMAEDELTWEQIAEGQRCARNFKPREMPSGNATPSVSDTSPDSSGTGFFITEDGFIVTNEHVVKNAVQIRVLTSSGAIPGKVVKVDSANDLALIKATGRFAALPVSSSRAVRLGATVATVGFPNIGLQGFTPKLAKGEIAALSGAHDDPRFFQVSVPVQPGNSGGALVDERGNVVGVVAAKLNVAAAVATSGALPENVNYAVKSSFLLSFLESVPEVSAKLKEPNTKECRFEDAVKAAEEAAVLVLVY